VNAFLVDGTELCAICACRRGLHHYGNERCPNPEWLAAPGYGREQWLWSHFSRARLPECGDVGQSPTADLQKLYTAHTV
jgi:hypothetical protein